MVTADELLTDVREDLALRGIREPSSAEIALSVQRSGGGRGGPALVDEVRYLAREFSGLGELAIPLGDPTVTDVLLNGPGPVWVDRGNGPEPCDIQIRDAAQCRQMAVRIATVCGVRIDDAHPFADGVLTILPPGVVARAVRFHAVLEPTAGQGACISLRTLTGRNRTLDSLERAGLFPAEVGTLLRTLIVSRRNLLISGGTGAGKTTLLSALLGEVPANQRMLLIEDTPELFPAHPQVVGLRTRESGADGTGEIGVRTLVRQSLRMRPDRIIVGEIRGAEIAELLLAFNTGHAGSAGTVHANGADAVIGRLLALGSLAGLPEIALLRQVVDGVDVVIHVERTGAGRRLARIGRFVLQGDRVVVDPVWDSVAGRSEAWDTVCGSSELCS